MTTTAATLKQTPLYATHQKLGALCVDFAGWSMPMHYGSQIEEHHTVRQKSGLFDVSHMGIFDLKGDGVYDFLRQLLANDVAKLKADHRGLYTCLLNQEGGIIDDLIVYRLSSEHYRLILNASRVAEDTAWIEQQAPAHLSSELLNNWSILALQGPEAIAQLSTLLTDNEAETLQQLKRFHSMPFGDGQIARTGYTGEDGVEIFLPGPATLALWEKLITAGTCPCGLGARDTLRLEAGYALYGTDMNETTTPLESNLTWTVSFKDKARDFIGKDALLKQKEVDNLKQLLQLRATTPGVLRNGQTIYCAEEIPVGVITSGSFSPTHRQAIALARLDAGDYNTLFVLRRNKKMFLELHKETP